MVLSEWQSRRVRNALSLFHAYRVPTDRDSEKTEPQNWQDVAEAIAEANAVERPPISSERLRQFVEGHNTPEGGRKYPEPKNVDAIIRFVTHEDYRLLSKDELQEYVPEWQAPVRLLEYLDNKLDAERQSPPSYLEGTYAGERTTEEALVVSELTLQRASKHGIIQAVQTDLLFDPSALSVRGMTAKERAKARLEKPIRKYGGWATLTPEDTLLLLMKDARYGLNHYYFSLASDLSRVSGEPVTRLTCLYHDYALEPEDGGLWDANMLSSAMVLLLENNIVHFRRISDSAGD